VCSFVKSVPLLENNVCFLFFVFFNNFSIQLEEIYDTNNYFDRDPSVPVTDYLANPNTVSTMDTILLSAGE
jgi:hypothetical protein